ncbi:MAG: 2-amino-4-hydroxy-6-hydroxymethyldihydropteridine diphosphokinase [Gemmatimonadales bacterium]
MRDVAYIALGSNLGDRAGYLARARAAIASLPGTTLVAASSIEETAPIGPVAQPPYFNQMVAAETTLAPELLLDELRRIESREGRVRGQHWGPRTLDLDIVRFDAQIVNTPHLTVPHPELPNREFWRRELAELEKARRRRGRR